MGSRYGARAVLGLACALTLTIAADSVGAWPALAHPPAAVAATAKQDIVIALDTTHMTAEEFALSQRGIAGFIDTLPGNGSTSISVIQFRNDGGDDYDQQAATVMLPLTTVEGEGNVQAILAAIRTGKILGTGAPAKDSVLRLTGSLLTGRTSESVLGIMAHRPPATSPDQEADRTFARNAGLDSLTVLGLSDDEDSLREEYAKTVFGGGQVTYAGSLPDLLDQLLSAMRGPALTLRALEVNQVIQDWNNSIPLIEDKDTMVRAFLRGPSDTPVTARLWGYHNGAPLPGSPLSPANIIPFFPVSTPDIPRENLYDSLNFSLPKSWANGTVDLRLDYSGQLSCTGAPGVDSSCTTTVDFIETETPNIDFFAVPYRVNGTRYEPDTAALWEQMLRVREQLPVANLQFRFRTLNSTFNPTVDILWDVNQSLLDLAAQEHCASSLATACLRRHVGVLDSITTNTKAGGVASGLPGQVASWFMKDQAPILSTGYLRNVGPHEVAHTYGAHHVVNEAENGLWAKSSPRDPTYKKGWCSEAADLNAPDYPWFYTLDDSAGNPQVYPTLGPLGDDDAEIWGGNPRSIRWNSVHAVIDPRQTYPLMSYCGANKASPGKWMSEPTYTHLIDYLGGTPGTPAMRVVRIASSTQMLVSGMAHLRDPQASRLDSVTPVDAFTWLDTDSSGSWALELFDSAGELLDRRAFDLAPSEALPVDGETSGMSEIEPFAVLFDDEGALGDLREIRLLFEGEQVASLEASGSAPTVSLVAPKSGTRVTGPRLDVSWTARDADRDALTATVLYRTGERSSWEVVATGVEGTSVSIPRERITASSDAQVRVIVSDGLLFDAADSGTFSVANNAPLLTSDPLTTVFPFIGSQPLTLRGDAWDPDEGDLGDYIRWESDRDGVLASGTNPLVLASELSEGMHKITISVEDSNGTSTRISAGAVRIQHVPYEFRTTLPGPVRGLRATPRGKQLVVTWVPPANAKAAGVRDYVYTVNGGPARSTTALRITLPLPKPGAGSTVSVAARGAAGTGKAANVAYRSK